MSEPSDARHIDPEHLNSEEVLRIVDFMADSDPIIVGGQSVNIWAEYYAGKDQSLEEMGPFTSKDIDFYRNQDALEQLATQLDDSIVYVPSIGEMTANAAVVVGSLGNRRVVVDFMAGVLGVEDDSIVDNFVAIEGTVPEPDRQVKLCLLHPLDCVRSRLANINILGRTDDHAIRQAVASLKILGHFIDDLLELGDYKNAQKTLHALPYLVRDMHLGSASFSNHGSDLDFCPIFERFLEDERLDQRWRELYFKRSVERLRDRIERRMRRLEQEPATPTYP